MSLYIPTAEQYKRLSEIKSLIEGHEATIAGVKKAKAELKKLNEEAKTIQRGGPVKKRAPRKPKVVATPATEVKSAAEPEVEPTES